MASNAPFELVRCTPDDMPELTQVLYDSFPEMVRTIFMGCHTPIRDGELDKSVQIYRERMHSDPNDVWIAVKDGETGKFIAGANWKVFVNGEGGDRNSDYPPPWLEGEDMELSKKVIGNMQKARDEAMPGAFLHLHICFTDAAYRRRGAGAMLMQWGVDLADQLFIPGYIEASKEGNFLYKTFGFYDYDKIDGGVGDGVQTMKRDVRKTPITGGKVKVPS